jgi:hypothetical protein
MLKRSILTFFWLFLLLAVYLASLLLLLMVKGQLDQSTCFMAFSIWVVLAALSFLPVLGMLIKKIWFFPGTGEPATLEQLREHLLAINAMAGPVQVIGKKKKLIVRWRHEETQWCELFSDLGISRLYELHCRFDFSTRTVLLADRIRTADFLICPERVKIGFLRIPLPFLRVRPGRLGTIERYITTAPNEYRFHPSEIKSPVISTILASGWNVRFSLF